MALGDGVRRNIRTVTSEERQRFVQALLALQDGAGGHAAEDGYLDPEALAAAARAHEGPSFLLWHRELCGRFERMLRRIDPELSLHYWDWNQDPTELFTPSFMEWGPWDAPFEGLLYGTTWQPEDAEVVAAPTFTEMRQRLAPKYEIGHFVYFGGDGSHGHIVLHDPLALLLHSNVDRLFAMWQAESGASWRLDPGQVYGDEHAVLASTLIEGDQVTSARRPSGGAKAQMPRSYVHASVIAPPCYDTLPIRVVVDQTTNPRNAINFTDVYRGKTFARAASFQVFGRGNVSFEVTSGPTGPYTVITPGGVVSVPHSAALYQEARVWFGFTGGVAHTTAPVGTVIIRCVETNQEFVFTLHANTIPIPATGLVLTVDEPSPRADPAQRSGWAGVTWTWTWRPA
jgi:hypothetical protein